MWKYVDWDIQYPVYHECLKILEGQLLSVAFVYWNSLQGVYLFIYIYNKSVACILLEEYQPTSEKTTLPMHTVHGVDKAVISLSLSHISCKILNPLMFEYLFSPLTSFRMFIIRYYPKLTFDWVCQSPIASSFFLFDCDRLRTRRSIILLVLSSFIVDQYSTRDEQFHSLWLSAARLRILFCFLIFSCFRLHI